MKMCMAKNALTSYDRTLDALVLKELIEEMADIQPSGTAF